MTFGEELCSSTSTSMCNESSETSKRRNPSKTNPVSAFSVGECSSQDELSKIVFTEFPVFVPDPSPPSVVIFPSSVSCCTSSASSVCSNKAITSDDQISPDRHHVKSTASIDNCESVSIPVSGNNSLSNSKPTELVRDEYSVVPTEHTTLYSYMPNGDKIPIRMSFSSRAGRAKQRWDLCPLTNRLIRLTTGCVPITNDGRILFVSSARKKEWILPKGGWELDEKMEESAARETYEEAGLLGTFGTKLTEITFETRKGMKRRLELLQSENGPSDNSPERVSTYGAPPQPKCNTNGHVNGIPQSLEPNIPSDPDHSKMLSRPNSLPQNVAFVSQGTDSGTKPMDLLKNGKEHYFQSLNNQDPNQKVEYDLCRMTLFPLYVSDVLDKWPESGRTRKIFTIDEAINITTREELKTILNEVKRRNLHIVPKLSA